MPRDALRPGPAAGDDLPRAVLRGDGRGARVRPATPRKPCHLETIEGGRKDVSERYLFLQIVVHVVHSKSIHSEEQSDRF